uniref:Metallothionein n=1 Tax=Cacopsylla melanoneura TaxID=428564 RepID=A0A8D9A2H9_9HEMI
MPKRACSSCRAKSASWPPRKARKCTSTTCTGGDQPTNQPRNSCSPSRNAQPMPPVMMAPIPSQMQTPSESTSVSSNSIQIDSAFACHCIECTKKTNCGCSCCCSFDCSKLRRHQSCSGMGDDPGDSDKPYIEDRYKLAYGNLSLLEVTFFVPKYGFKHLDKK